MLAAVAAAALASCRGPEVDKPAVTRDPAPAGKTVSSLPATPAMVPDGSATTLPAVVIAGAAPGAIYVCVTELAGQTQQRAIELAPEVAKLCRKAPEMGPCQYERATCRRSGGRVFTVDGTEITLQTEAEYDRRVMRVRMKSN
jgi:hypothetical protein